MTTQQFWDLAFIQLYGWTLHPGWGKYDAPPPTMGECALLADKMLIMRRKQWPQDSSEPAQASSET